jgi:hypothetical protein
LPHHNSASAPKKTNRPAGGKWFPTSSESKISVHDNAKQMLCQIGSADFVPQLPALGARINWKEKSFQRKIPIVFHPKCDRRAIMVRVKQRRNVPFARESSRRGHEGRCILKRFNPSH